MAQRIEPKEEIDLVDDFNEHAFEHSSTTKREYVKAIVSILLSHDEDWLDQFYRELKDTK